MLPKHERPWINSTKLNGSKQRSDLKALCQSNSAQVQSFASKMHETNVSNINSFMMHKRDEYNSRHKPFEKHIKLEQQAAHTAQEYLGYGTDMLRQQADEQPDKEKLLWKRHLSQQADYQC